MFVGQRLIPLVSSEPTASLDTLRDLVEANALRPRIGSVWPFAQGAQAVAELRARRVNGRIVVSLEDCAPE